MNLFASCIAKPEFVQTSKNGPQKSSSSPLSSDQVGPTMSNPSLKRIHLVAILQGDAKEILFMKRVVFRIPFIEKSS